MALTTVAPKIINKISTVPGQLPTLGPSFDYTDGTWNATDIYEGEIFMNTADKKVYTILDNVLVDLTASFVNTDEFILLTDTPNTYTGNGGKTVKVNSAENALEFVTETPIEDFIDLNDTPNTYTGNGGKIVKVNSTENALEFVTETTPIDEFIDLTDTPASYTGNGGKTVKVNSTEDALEFVTETIIDEFINLNDTPASYTGNAGKILKVNSTEDALEFVNTVDYVALTLADLQLLKANSTLIPGKFYYITDRDIMLTAVKNNDFALTGSRVFNIIKDSYYTPSTSTIGAVTTYYGGIYGQTIARGSYPNSVSGSSIRYVIWGGQMWQRDNSGADTPGTSSVIIQSGWTLIPRDNTIFYETKIFDIKYDIDTDKIIEQSDDRGNVIISTPIPSSFNYFDITDWGNVNMRNNKCYGIFNNFQNSTTKANIYNNSNTGSISGFISNNSNNGEISSNSNNGDHANISNNSNTSRITNNSNTGSIIDNSNNGRIDNNSNNGYIQNNSNNGYIEANSNNGEILGNSNSGDIESNSNSGVIWINSNNGRIYNNSNNGGIWDNSNTGEIRTNSNNGYISVNSNSGQLSVNSNTGEITTNSSLSTGTFDIVYNMNNGFINYNQSNTTSAISIIKCMNNGDIGNTSTPVNRTANITQTQVDL